MLMKIIARRESITRLSRSEEKTTYISRCPVGCGNGGGGGGGGGYCCEVGY